MVAGFTFTPKEDPGAANIISSKATVVKTEYFNIQGVRLSAPVNGVTIIKNTMSDGSIITKKGVFVK